MFILATKYLTHRGRPPALQDLPVRNLKTAIRIILPILCGYKTSSFIIREGAKLKGFDEENIWTEREEENCAVRNFKCKYKFYKMLLGWPNQEESDGPERVARIKETRSANKILF
jgi:hypothetical protein